MKVIRKLSNLYPIKALVLIFTGTLSWSLTMVKSGIVYEYGAGFWGPNGHDGIWHIALSQGLARGSWEMPIFAGEVIKNYHIGFDLILAALNKITFIPPSILYFQVLPPLLALGIGLSVYNFVATWKKSKQAAFWATFFVYFSGSWGWLVTLVKNGSIDGESLFWAQQAMSTLVNPPFAFSLIILFSALGILAKYANKSNKKLQLKKKYLGLAAFLFGVLVQVKVYAAILALGGLFVAGMWRLIKKRRNLVIKVFSGSLVFSVLLFLPLSSGAEKTITFKPFWFLETMMSFNDRLGWNKFGEAMVNYKMGGIWLKAVLAYVAAFTIFIIGNIGIRIVALAYVYKIIRKKLKLDYLDLLIFTVIVGGITYPMLFVQSGTAWNTIQFFYYSLVFMGVLAGIQLSDWLTMLKKGKRRFVLMSVVVLLTVPIIYATLRHYLPARPPAMVSINELEALEFLRSQEDGVVLVLPFNRTVAQEVKIEPPRPLFLYESTAYVSAYSNKPSYIEDEVNLEITGYNWRERRSKLVEFFSASSENKAGKFLTDNKIKYFYWNKVLYGLIREDQNLVEKIFENSEIAIYRTKVN